MSTGKLLSNMQRSGPKASILLSTKGLNVSANSDDDGGILLDWKSVPLMRMAMPPSFAVTFSHRDKVRMEECHSRKVSSRRVRVYDLAHARSGDKGNTSNVAVIAYNDEAWEILRGRLTAEKVMHAYAHLAQGPIHRYEVPKLRALNFVIENALAGGVTTSFHKL